MVKPLITFAKRRWRNGILTLLAVIGVIAWSLAYDVALYQSAYLTGWLLLIIIIVLTIYNLRKKLSMIPIGSAAAWLQWHIYLGVLAIIVFALHISWNIPNGILEIILALFFVTTAGSGVIGIYLSRKFAGMLTRRTEEVVLERIPQFISELRQTAEELVLRSTVETNSSTIADYYSSHLSSYFAGPRNMLRHLSGSRSASFSRFANLDIMTRYLNEKEMSYAEDLRSLMERKDQLDYAYALQVSLKAWLFVHVPATYGLIILAILHLILVYSFGGSS